MDITTKSVEELKALAYDTLVELDRAQANLKIVEGELEKRKSLPANVVQEESK